MKKRALVAGVLLSVFSLGMSAQAAMTISSAGETTLSDTDASSWNDIWGDGRTPCLSITGDNEKTLNFIADAGSASDDVTIAISNSSNKGIGIYHEAGTTYFNGLDLSIGAGYHAIGDDDGYKAIHNQSGNLYFNNNIKIIVSVNDEAIHNEGTMVFSKGLNLNRRFETEDTSLMDGAIENYGTMKINGNNIVIVSINKDGIETESIIDNSGKLYINENNLEGNYYLSGDIRHWGNATTEINLKGIPKIDENSYVITALLQGEIRGSNKNFKLNIEGMHSAWDMGGKQDEDVYGVTLKDGGIIWINSSNWEKDSTAWDNNYKNVGFVNLKSDDSSIIAISTDLKNNEGDRVTLYFDNERPTLSSLNISIINKDDNNGVEIKEADGHSVTIARVEGTEPIKLNTYLSFYNTNSEDGSIKLMNPIIKEEVFSNTHDMLNGRDYNFVGWEAGGGKTTSKEKDQQLDGFDLNATELDNTLKRINDIRTDPSEVGAWIRGESGKMKIRSYSYKYNLTSGGYDWDFESDAAKMFLGFGISYAKNDCDTGMIGDTKSMGYNLYGSWLGKENKDYFDVILKYGKLDKKYAGLDDNNVFVRGDYDKNLFSIAAKYGRRIAREDGWYYEPSVGLTWGRIGSADFTDSQGIHIHADSSTSKMASLGMQVGKKVQGTEFYGLVQVRHDFDGKMHVSVPGSDLPGSSVNDDMGGPWYKVGIGAARKINKNNSFYLDLEKDFGNKVKKPYSIGAGYRYTW